MDSIAVHLHNVHSMAQDKEYTCQLCVHPSLCGHCHCVAPAAVTGWLCGPRLCGHRPLCSASLHSASYTLHFPSHVCFLYGAAFCGATLLSLLQHAIPPHAVVL
jgi:hypothetical protein